MHEKPERMEEIKKLLDENGKAAEKRMEEASDTMVGLLPATTDWMTHEELQRRHELILESMSLESKWRAGARERILARRAKRMADARKDG